MRVVTDPVKCDGYANCLAAAPDVFDLDDAGLVRMLIAPSETHRDAVEAAVRACPAGAIRIEED